MSAHTKKHLTNEDVKILVFGQELELKKSLKASLVNIINEVVDLDSYSSEEVHGKWLNSPRMRVAKYLKGSRKREGLTQKDVCDKLDIQQSNYSSMERGERPIPEHLVSGLAKLLNVKSKMLDEEQVEKKLKAS
jgi:DNA-binding XRE family transcriptional regulator